MEPQKVIVAGEATKFITDIYPVAQKFVIEVQQYNMILLCIPLAMCKFLGGLSPEDFISGSLDARLERVKEKRGDFSDHVLSIFNERLGDTHQFKKGELGARFDKGQEILDVLEKDASVANYWVSDWIDQRGTLEEKKFWSGVTKAVLENEVETLKDSITKFMKERLSELPEELYVRKET